MLVSVIIPVYNVEKYLRESLSSIQNQTLNDLEIIGVDDGSQDDGGAILDEYAAKDARFKIVRQKNAGLSAARNAGLDVATGKYVFFLDSDDFVAPTTCERAVAVAEKTGADATIFGGWDVAEDGRTVIKEWNPRDFFSSEIVDDRFERLAKIFQFWGPAVWKFCWKRSFLEENSLRFLPGFVCEDVPFSSPAIALANRVAVCPEPFYYYRQRDNSIIRSVDSAVFRGGAARAYNAALDAIERRFLTSSAEKNVDFAVKARRFLLQQKIKFAADADARPLSAAARVAFEASVREELVDGETDEIVRGTFEYCSNRRRVRKNARALYYSFDAPWPRRLFCLVQRRIRRAVKNNRLNVRFKKFLNEIKRTLRLKK